MRRRIVAAIVVLGLMALAAPARAGGTSWTSPAVLGYPGTGGDDWEPDIAADAAGHVYVLWKHYSIGGDCGAPCNQKETLQVSNDGGKSWSAPRVMDPIVGYDSQISVDPADGRTVWASWLEGKKDTVAERSTDYGQTWTAPIRVENLNKYTDKDVLAVRGKRVSIAYNHAQAIYASTTLDGGATWSTVKINEQQSGQLGWSLPSGGAIDPQGRIYFAWEGFKGSGRTNGPNGPVYLYLTRSLDGGQTWQTTLLRSAADTPNCNCAGWAFWGPSVTLALSSGGIDVLETADTVVGGPNRLWFQRSIDNGVTFSPAIELAANGAMHLFPALTSAGSDVRASWMDDRSGPFRVYYSTSATGTSWSRDVPISGSFPSGYGDYMGLAVGINASTQAVWGEGPSYNGPGQIYYARTQ